MIGTFKWYESRLITETQRSDVEAKIREDVERGFETDFRPCHPGQVSVHLNLVGPLLSDLVGNIKCHCGKPYCKINGTNDASKVTYERVD